MCVRKFQQILAADQFVPARAIRSISPCFRASECHALDLLISFTHLLFTSGACVGVEMHNKSTLSSLVPC